MNHRSLPVYGDGLQIRDWLYVRDHCKALDMTLSNGRPGEIYNVGGHNERTNLFIIKTILNYIKNNVDPSVDESLITHVRDRKGHDRRYAIAPDKIRRDLGWYPETPFEKGILLTLEWYINNREWTDNITSGQYREYYDNMYGVHS